VPSRLLHQEAGITEVGCLLGGVFKTRNINEKEGEGTMADVSTRGTRPADEKRTGTKRETWGGRKGQQQPKTPAG